MHTQTRFLPANGKASDAFQSLKWAFYEHLSKKRLADKGSVRSYVAVSTWLRERELKGDNKYTAHIKALEGAIQDYEAVQAKGHFQEEFKHLLSRWRSEGGAIERAAGGEPLITAPVRVLREWRQDGLSLVSLFSGAFGLDLGFVSAGFSPRVALDIDGQSEATMRENMPGLPFIRQDINLVPSHAVLRDAGLDVGEADVVTGGPPCQPFSTAGRRQSLTDPRASPVREFVRFIKEAKPKCFVMEEVEGLLSARIKHVPIAQREGRSLTPEELPGSAFSTVLTMLGSTGYKLVYGILNAADFGAPQERRRLIIIGSKDTVPELPRKTHSCKPQRAIDGIVSPWNTFWEATVDLQGGHMEYKKLFPSNLDYLTLVPPGSNWRQLPEDALRGAMAGAYDSTGGKMGYYRRLTWDTPSPTVVMSPVRKGTLLCHPEELRPVSVEEYKRVQGFPDDWEIPGTISAKYKLIGNAVPVYLSHAIAQGLAQLIGT
jgi:DNA (cytosine-5)-methyltransferase 1